MNAIKKLFQPIDMTVGEPWKNIIIFTIPMLLGNIAQQLYNTVDSVVIGRYVGDNALAAVGSGGPVLMLLNVLFIGISMGASIMVSQHFGAKRREDLSKTIGNCITLTGIAAIIIMIASLFLVRPMLELIKTPESIIDWTASYLLILFLGCAGGAYYNILSGILRGLGNAGSALLYLLVATVINIALDLLFVTVFHWGVPGVALATIIAQFVSALCCLLKLMRMREHFDMDFSQLKLSRGHALRVIRLGLPSGLTQAIFSMAMVMVQSLTNSFGEMFIAANVVVMRVDGFAMMPNFSFGTAMTTFVGQNVGARRLDRVKQGARQGTLIAVGTAITLTSLILIFGRQLMGVFTDTEELIQLSRDMMSIIAVGYIAMAVTQCLSGVMRGAGDTMTPMWISLFTTVIVRVPTAYTIAYLTRSPEFPGGRRECTYISLLTAWLTGALITTICYASGRWKKKAEKSGRIDEKGKAVGETDDNGIRIDTVIDKDINTPAEVEPAEAE